MTQFSCFNSSAQNEFFEQKKKIKELLNDHKLTQI